MVYKLYDLQLTGDLIQKERKTITSSREKFCSTALQTWGIDISPESLKKWETGNVQEISINNLIKLCNIFDCELDYLLGQQEYKKKAVADICAETGLSKKALIYWHQRKKRLQRRKGQLIDEIDYDQIIICLTDGFISSFLFSQEKEDLSIVDRVREYLQILIQKNIFTIIIFSHHIEKSTKIV